MRSGILPNGKKDREHTHMNIKLCYYSNLLPALFRLEEYICY